MIATMTYVRKPLYVEAVLVTPENFNEMALWCQGEIQEITERGRTFQFIAVRVTNPMNPRQGQARVGDWILTSERGYKVYTPKAFEKAFDLASEHSEEPIMMQTELAQGMAAVDPAQLKLEAKEGHITAEEAEMIAVAQTPVVPTNPVGSGPMPDQAAPTDVEEPSTVPSLPDNLDDPNVVYPVSPETTVG